MHRLILGKLMGGVALLAAAVFLFVAQAYAANIGVAGTKYIVIDKGPGAQKSVFVSKDPGANKNGNDIENISVVLSGRYDGTSMTATQEFDVPNGSGNGWVADKDTVAKYVNKDAPSGPTSAKVAVIKPAKLLKLVAKSTGDSATLDMIGVGAPSGSVFTDYQVTSGGTTDNFCTEWQGCAFKEIAAGAGRKLVCKGGVPDGSCVAAPACDVFAQDCPAGQGCDPTGSVPEAQCFTAGSGTQGVSCSSTTECAAGFLCAQVCSLSCTGECLTMCDVTSPTCPGGTTCQAISGTGIPNFGVCF